MFKDKQEELKRLEEELLQEEFLEEEEQETPEENTDTFLEDTYFFGKDTPENYRNYSNDYGNYRAYNTDTTDEDLEAYSEEVREPKRQTDIWILCAIALCLMIGIIGVLGWWAVRFLGR